MGDVVDLLLKAKHPQVLLADDSIRLILTEIKSKDRKCNMLVYGAGHDSRLWREANTGGKTSFVEHVKKWIEECGIPMEDCIHYEYKSTKVATSLEISEEDLKTKPEFQPPTALLETKWDIILIDGPCGYEAKSPGRLLPIYWSCQALHLAPGAVLFVDDAGRNLESICLQKYALSDKFRRQDFAFQSGFVRLEVVDQPPPETQKQSPAIKTTSE